MKLRVWPYKMGSRSGRAIARMLGVLRVYGDGDFRWRNSAVINWGNSQLPVWWDERKSRLILNHPRHVQSAKNKLLAFRCFEARQVPTLTWTDRADVAASWGAPVVVRHTLTGHGGAGIEIVQAGNPLPHAHLYTKYQKRKDEWRVHVVNGRVVDWAVKKHRAGQMPRSFEVRNHENGWVMVREGRNLPPALGNAAIEAVKAVGLDFGAVDVLEKGNGEVAVLEVNSAPGMEEFNTTAGSYARAFAEWYRLVRR